MSSSHGRPSGSGSAAAEAASPTASIEAGRLLRAAFDAFADATLVFSGRSAEGDDGARLLVANRAMVRLAGLGQDDGLAGARLVDLFGPELFDRGALLGGRWLEPVDVAVVPPARCLGEGGRVLEATASRLEGYDLGLLVLRDVTRTRAAQDEEQALAEQLRETQKLEALGRLAGGVAHDMNNLLGVVMNLASVLHDEAIRGEAPEVGRLEHDTATILDAGRKARELTQNLLGFARRGTYRFESVDLNVVVARALQGVWRRRSEVSIDARLAEGLPFVLGDEAQLRRAVENLCRNAVEAIAPGGRVRVVTEHRVLDETTLSALTLAVPPGHYVGVRVEDDGVGMDEDTLARAFEPFFTTKAPGHGTGLGLSMVYGTLRDHYGTVQVETAPGAGTSVQLWLPAEEADPTSRRTRKASVSREAEGVALIVDDERLVRRSEERMFRRLGFETLTASSGREAVDLYRAHQARIAVVLLDLVMPGMDGHAVLDALQSIDPNVRVVISTGFSEVRITDQAGPTVALLRKPFELDGLVAQLEWLGVPLPD